MLFLYVVGIGLGVIMIAAAVFNWTSMFADNDSRVVEQIGGETAVRWFWAAGGVVSIGIAIFCIVKG